MQIPYRKVLIVEDDSQWQEVYREIIDEAGYSHQSARTIEEALARLEREFFHLALVDLRLDVTRSNLTQGFEVLEEIRRLKEGTATVVITGQIDFEQTKKALGIQPPGKQVPGEYQAVVDIFVKDEFEKYADEFPDLMRKWILEAWDKSRATRNLDSDRFVIDILPEVITEGVSNGEIAGVKQSLRDFFDTVYPLRRVKGSAKTFVDKDNKPQREVVYWSRIRGEAVLVKTGDAPAMQRESMEFEQSHAKFSDYTSKLGFITALKAKTPKYPPRLGVLVYTLPSSFESLVLE